MCAVSSEDYSRVSTTLYFQRCAEEHCATVSISYDNVMEPEIESFTVALENRAADTRLTVSSQPSTIQIEDDDGLCRTWYRNSTLCALFS